MNVEKLYTIAMSVVEDLTNNNVLQTLSKINSVLSSITSQSNNGTHLQELSNQLSQLRERCEKSGINDYSPLWLQTLDEIGLYPMGSELFQFVDEIIQRNQLTVPVAQKEIAEIYSKLNARKTALEQMVKSFSALELGNESLAEGDCEVGIMIPRGYVDNSLSGLSGEFDALGDALLVFEEVATGGRSEFKVNSIGSSDFGLYLAAAAPTALVISKVIEKLMNSYKTYWEVREIKQKLQEKSVPVANLEGLETHINDIVKKSIEECVEELLEGAHESLDSGRKNELRTELRLSMNKLANRVDRGFNLEIRVNKPQVDYNEDGESSSEYSDEEVKVYDDIKAHSSNFTYIDTSEVPVIDLPEREEDLKKSKTVKKKTTKKKSGK